MVFCSGVTSGRPATASTKEGATEEENCRFGKKRQSPVSSIHVRASSKVSVPRPFWRILSARACTNCSDVKEKPQFRVGASARQPSRKVEDCHPCFILNAF